MTTPTDRIIPEITPEQEQRRDVLFSLQYLKQAQQQYRHLISPYGNTLWIHITDTHFSGDTIIDIQQLMTDGILIRADDVYYQLQGDWRDRFAPSAFLLTRKGQDILNNPSAWVWDGVA